MRAIYGGFHRRFEVLSEIFKKARLISIHKVPDAQVQFIERLKEFLIFHRHFD